MTKQFLFLTLIVLCFGLLQGLDAIAQKFYDSPKYGKVSNEEWQMKSYQKDSSAGALILFDIGSVYLDDQLNIVFERHTRIKLFNRSAFEMANNQVLYAYSERLNIDAQTIVMGTDGKEMVYKVENKQIFDTRHDQNFRKKAFTYPNIGEGCIVECRYKRFLASPVFLRNWYFQSPEFPVLHSQYNLSLPDGWDYTILYKGLYPITSKSEKPFKLDLFKYNMKIFGTTFIWNMDSIPAFEEEPFMGSIYDNIAQLTGRMNSYIPLGGTQRQSLSSDWKKIKADYKNMPQFGDRISGGAYFKKILEANPKLTNGSHLQNAKNIYAFVQKQMNWNREYEQFGDDQRLSAVFEKHTAGSADINFILINLLNAAGLTTTPVLISTRSHGDLEMSYPSQQQFNHVIVLLNTPQADYFLDAIDGALPFGMLPLESLNRRGFLINKTDEQQWVETNIMTGYQSNEKMVATIDAEGNLSGSLRLTENGYEAYRSRKRMAKDGEKKAITDYYSHLQPQIQIDSFKVNNLENDSLPLVTTMHFRIPEFAQVSGNHIYMNPNFFAPAAENPFKATERLSPIDFGTTLDAQSTLAIKIPEGYKVDINTAEQLTITTDSTAYHQRKFVVNANSVQILDKFVVAKPYYHAHQYADLRKIFAAFYSDNTITFKK